MANDLAAMGRDIALRLEIVAAMAPGVVSTYQNRLNERVQALVSEHGLTIEPKDLIREVAVFAERTDIAEEVTRLRAHLDQYLSIVEAPEKRRQEARICRSGDGPRDQHHRLKGRRRGDQSRSCRDQGAPREDS